MHFLLLTRYIFIDQKLYKTICCYHLITFYNNILSNLGLFIQKLAIRMSEKLTNTYVIEPQKHSFG